MKKNTGFTLIEVLIAMIILAVGLLGLAGLQATTLKNNQSAYNRIKATQLAYDIADRMRANYDRGQKAEQCLYYYLAGHAAAVANCTNTLGCTPAKWRKMIFSMESSSRYCNKSIRWPARWYRNNNTSGELL